MIVDSLGADDIPQNHLKDISLERGLNLEENDEIKEKIIKYWLPVS